MAEYQPKLPPLDPCPVEAELAIIGGRWTARILYEMLDRGVRLTDLRPSIPRATQPALSSQVRHLCRAGVIERVAGESLKPVLWAIAQWGIRRIEGDWTEPEANFVSSPD